MSALLTALDDYFCETYENYDKLCMLPGYQMPKMQDTRIGEDGLTYAYTLPSETMSLSRQTNKAEILKELKNRAFDQTFSFSFQVQSIFSRIANLFLVKSPGKVLRTILAKHALTKEQVNELLTIDKEVFSGIYKGKFIPTKNCALSIALVAEFTVEEIDELFEACGYGWDFTLIKDTVLSYLLINRVYNVEMIRLACKEYNVENLFIRFEK